MTVKLQYPFRGILERSWRSLPLWSVFSYCFMKPLCSRASQPFMKWWSVNSESLQLPQQHTVHFHWPWANPVYGLKQIIPIMVVLRGRISLPIPSKAQNMLGNRLGAVFALVLWEKWVSHSHSQPSGAASRIKIKENKMKEKKNELQQNVRVKFKTQWN